MAGTGGSPPPARDWEAAPSVVRAREHLERGRHGAAAREAWKAATLAVNADDERGFAVVRELAREIEERSSGRAQRQAAMVGAYVEHCTDASEAGTKQGSLLARLFWTPKAPRAKTCPDCAEQVKLQARVCRFCGHRFDAGEP